MFNLYAAINIHWIWNKGRQLSYIKHIMRNKKDSILTINDKFCFKMKFTQEQIISIYSFL